MAAALRRGHTRTRPKQRTKPTNMDDHEKRLWRRYRQTRKQPARDQLRNEIAERYLPLARRMARRMADRLPSSVDFDDLHSAAYQGLLIAIPRFEPARGLAPSTFLGCRINGAMLDFVRTIDHAPRLYRQRVAKVQRWEETTLGRTATAEEIESHFGWRLKRPPAVISLHESRGTQTHPERTLGDLIPDRRSGVGNAGVGELSEILRGCSKRERLLLILYYLEELKMSEIARHFGISESRVSQMMTNLLARLRSAAAA